MAQSSPMNSGNGAYSYIKNSTMQRNAASAAEDALKKAVIEGLDLKRLPSSFSIADLGCSVGPNTFFSMQTLIETVEQKYMDSKQVINEFQVLFNDVASNDFNTLFASLPETRNYFAAGVPGSFYDRLFPSSSIHIAYSSYSLHWLSKQPKELQVKGSPAWNAGRIHYTGASDAVVKAYADAFEEDVETFLSARAEEIVAGGLLVIIMPGVPDGDTTHGIGLTFTFLESILMDMVEEGLIKQDQVGSFNIPHVYPSIKEMRRLVEKNGRFEVIRMELRSGMPAENGGGSSKMVLESAIMHLRAFSEGTFANHFGEEIVDQLFERAIQQKLRLAHMYASFGKDIAGQLFAVLKHK